MSALFWILGLSACVLHMAVRALRWRFYADNAAKLVYLRHPGAYSEKLVLIMRKSAEEELRSNTGISYLLGAPLYPTQRFAPYVAALCLWVAGARVWAIAFPLAAWFTSWAYFRIMGGRWLVAACRRRLRHIDGAESD